MQKPAAVILAVCACACAKPAEAPLPPTPVPVKTVPAATVPVPPADAHREAYEEAKQLIRDWEGDQAKLETAREKLMAILARDKAYAPAYVGLARVEYESGYMRGNDFDSTSLNRGWKLVQHALKLDPNLFDAHVTAGWISRYMGEMDSARASFDRAEELRPGAVAVKLGRAELAEADNRRDEVMRLAKEVIATPSADARQKTSAYGYMLEVYRSGGHADQMDATYREQLKIRPNSAWIHGNYADFLLWRGDVDGAIREAEAAVKILPYPIAMSVLARGLLTKAEAQWNANQVLEAGRTIERIADLAGDDPNVLAGMGAFYERAAIRGKNPALRDQALAWYEKALAKAPDDREIRKAVERLRGR